MSKLLIAGAGGLIGQNVAEHLYTDYDLTLVDLDLSEVDEKVKKKSHLIETDLTQADAWDDIFQTEFDYIIFLAANPDFKAEFDDLLELNFVMPHYMFEAAAKQRNLKRIIFASSIHASDGYPQGVQVKTTDPARPDGYYGVSKVYVEALASYFAYERGVPSIGIRIGDYQPKEKEVDPAADLNGLAQYFSEADMNHLIDCCLQAELKEPYLLVNGLSNNTFTRLEIASARNLIGYNPQDNAFEIENVDN